MSEEALQRLKSMVQQSLCKECSDAFSCTKPCEKYLVELELVQAEERRHRS
jgi:hypothetical protein